jgi:hypothetical protein
MSPLDMGSAVILHSLDRVRDALDVVAVTLRLGDVAVMARE